jgi:hypothetical protein
MYGVHKTTIYIPHDLKRQLEQAAARQGRTVAELVRQALQALVDRSVPPRPRLPLFESGKPDLAEHADEALAGFGQA